MYRGKLLITVDITPKAKATKPKIDKGFSIQLKILWRVKETTKNIKRQLTESEKIFAYHTPDDNLTSKKYK